MGVGVTREVYWSWFDEGYEEFLSLKQVAEIPLFISFSGYLDYVRLVFLGSYISKRDGQCYKWS